MIGYITEEDLGLFQVAQRIHRCEGLKLLELAFSQKKPWAKYRWRKAGRLLQSQRVRRLWLSREASLPPVLQDVGMRLYDPLPSLQGLGDMIFFHKIHSLGLCSQSITLRLCGKSAQGALGQVARRLCPVVAGISIQAEEGGVALQERLYQDFGMAPPSPGQDYDGTLWFGGECPPKTRVFLQLHSVSSDDFYGISPRNGRIPPGLDPLVFVALGVESGKIPRELIDFT